VYGFEPIICCESVRDHLDLLLSMKSFPFVTSLDLSSMLDKHGNNRHKELIHPYEGRLVEPNQEIIALAEKGRLTCPVEGLKQSDKKTRDPTGHYTSGGLVYI